MGDVLQERFVLFAQRYPVIAMHVRHIEPVAITPPDFVEDLVPLFGRNTIHNQTGRCYRLAGLVTQRSCVVETKSWSLPHQNFRPIARHRITENVVGDDRLFAFLKGEDL